ncbi:hypothetical protein [Micromonospora violae]|uniref:hypothetical protein n=1 Tax=Micromonospora violae TaxID=1278207 RepID=UPI0033E053C6
MDSENVSFETAFEHYSVYRWKIERGPAQRLVEVWSKVANSELHPDVKIVLTDVAWALAAFERAHETLEFNALRVEKFKSNGAPAVMTLLSGPYRGSLDYNLTISLWMDIADVFVWYRTICERLGKLKTCIRKAALPLIMSELESQINTLKRRRISAFGGATAVDLANELLHKSRHPVSATDLSLNLYWTGKNHEIVDFTESGEARSSLGELRRISTEQVVRFIDRLVEAA